MPTTYSSRHAAPGSAGSTPVSPVGLRPSPWLWMVGGAALFFATPLVGTDVFGLQPDLFYLGYFTIAVVWFAAFLLTYRTKLSDLWQLNLTPSLLVGAVTGIGVSAIVFSSPCTEIGRVLGVDIQSDAALRQFISSRPFVAFRPAEVPA